MKELKFIKLLQSLQKEEFRRLGKFLRSPFYNYTSAQVRLYDYLRKYYPVFEEKKLVKEKAWNRIFPDERFNANKFWKLCSNFGKMVEKFIVVMQLEQQPQEEKKIFIRAMGQRNVYDLFKKETGLYLKKQKAKPYRDSEYYTDKAHLYFDYFFHPLTQKLTLQDDALTELMDSLDKQFALMKYRIGSELKNRERILTKKYEMRFMEAIEKEGANGFLRDNAMARIYRSLFELYDTQEGHFAFYQLKKLFLEYVGELRRWDIAVVATQLLNYTVRQINGGNTAFNLEAFDIYKLGIENELVVDNGRIDAATFGNIVNVGCNAGEYKWTLKFIEDYQKYLKEKVRADMVAMSMADWYFLQNDFENAFAELDSHSFSHFYQPKVRMNIIRILFERFLADPSHYFLLVSKIENFEKFLHRNDVITDARREAQLNFAMLVKRLSTVLFENKNPRKLITPFSEMLADKKRVAARRWLEAKIGQLKGQP